MALLILPLSVFGQDSGKTIPINVSYFGETIVHPGLEIGYENGFLQHFNYTVSAGTYLHQRYQTGLFINAGVNWRYTFSFGYSIELGLGLGYLHTWQHGGDTYIVDDSGNVSIKTEFLV